MTDPFRDGSGPATGFGGEVYIESPALVGADFDTIRTSWELDSLRNFAATVADMGGITGHLERFGVVSMELYAPDGIAEEMVSGDRIGIMIGLEAPARPAEVSVAPGETIRMIPITLLTPGETAHIVDGGAAGRREVAGKLLETGVGVVSVVGRPSVV